MGSLDGKTAVVTGAAHGLGRLHAMGLAAQGANVVVNDLGVTKDGEGRDETAAQAVVDEIKAAGGEATAHFGDVADMQSAEGMIQQAIDTYGDLHILINNAGFTRDNTIYKMTEDEFDSVVRVHLKGHFAPSKFAMNYWRAKSKQVGGPIYGRLLSSASESWMMGNPGQANYAPAKAGIVSLTMGIAQLGQKMGVTANVVMPRARTRMTLQGPFQQMFEAPEEGFDNFNPENSSPLFVYLCTPAAERITGQLFIIWGQEVQILCGPKATDTFRTEGKWSVEELGAKLTPHYEKLTPGVGFSAALV